MFYEDTREVFMKCSIAIPTPLGTMIATGDESYIYSLEFSDKIIQNTGVTPALQKLEHELGQYFNNQLTHFTSKLNPEGTAFQKTVWQALANIPYGQTRSYKQIATQISQEKAFRAVANANARNPILILIPCHRVIAHNGQLAGFAAGVEKKEWLLKHESI